MAQNTMEAMEQRARKILAESYTRIMKRQPDGRVSAEILEFEGCFAEGDSDTDACGNLEKAATAWLISELEAGATIPPPLNHEDAPATFLWRPPRSLHARVIVAARMDGTSTNQWLTVAVAEKIGALSVAAHPALHLIRQITEFSFGNGPVLGLQQRSQTDREEHVSSQREERLSIQ